jgi:hypothetical protein
VPTFTAEEVPAAIGYDWSIYQTREGGFRVCTYPNQDILYALCGEFVDRDQPHPVMSLADRAAVARGLLSADDADIVRVACLGEPTDRFLSSQDVPYYETAKRERIKTVWAGLHALSRRVGFGRELTRQP